MNISATHQESLSDKYTFLKEESAQFNPMTTLKTAGIVLAIFATVATISVLVVGTSVLPFFLFSATALTFVLLKKFPTELLVKSEVIGVATKELIETAISISTCAATFAISINATPVGNLLTVLSACLFVASAYKLFNNDIPLYQYQTQNFQ